MRGRYEPAVLTAAITGGDVLPSQSPYVPCGAAAIIEEAVAAASAGASCVHLHGREEDGRPSGRPELLREIAEGVRSRCDVVLNFSTGGTPGMPEEERLAALAAARPEIGTLNIGTMSYELFPDPSRAPEVGHNWERDVVGRAGDGVFINTLNTVRRFAQAFREIRVTPEVECYDMGHLEIARFLLDEGTLEPPVRVQLVMGVFGGIGNQLEDLVAMGQAARRLIGGDLGALAVAATGYPMQLRCSAAALGWGLDSRVGLEDSLRIERRRVVKSNAELVAAAVEVGRILGRPIARPEQLRAELGPWRR